MVPGRLLLTILISVCCRPTIGDKACHRDGPEDCNFNKNLCSWVANGSSWARHAGLYGSGRGPPAYLRGTLNSTTGHTLTSRLACSTHGQKHCLSFIYFLFHRRPSFLLNVFVTNNNRGAKQKVWSLSSASSAGGWLPRDRRWQFAVVPIETDFDFVVELEVTPHPSKSATKPGSWGIVIHSIAYKKNASCVLEPASAAVTSTTVLATTNLMPDNTITAADPLPGKTDEELTETKEHSENSGVMALVDFSIIAAVASTIIILIIATLVIYCWMKKLQTRMDSEEVHFQATHNPLTNYMYFPTEPEIADPNFRDNASHSNVLSFGLNANEVSFDVHHSARRHPDDEIPAFRSSLTSTGSYDDIIEEQNIGTGAQDELENVRNNHYSTPGERSPPNHYTALGTTGSHRSDEGERYEPLNFNVNPPESSYAGLVNVSTELYKLTFSNPTATSSDSDSDAYEPEPE